MNQILVTKKLYITPELKRKKKIYKFNFFLSIFIMVSLISVYIYAEYDKNKSAEVSGEILEQINVEVDNTTTTGKVLVATLDNEEINSSTEGEIFELLNKTEEDMLQEDPSQIIHTFNGYNYKTIGIISIPKIGVYYPILDGELNTKAEDDELLKTAPIKFWGPDLNEDWGAEPNQVGNLCIAGHNYWDERFFGQVPTLVVGDIIEIIDMEGNIVKYSVYDKFNVAPDDNSSTTQKTNGRTEITLITCTEDSSERVIVKARKI